MVFQGFPLVDLVVLSTMMIVFAAARAVLFASCKALLVPVGF